VTRLPVSWPDFEKDLEHKLEFKTKSWRNFTKRGAIIGCRKYFLFKQKLVSETSVTNLGEYSAILISRDGYEGDFFILLLVHVCFNSYIDYAICKLNYE